MFVRTLRFGVPLLAASLLAVVVAACGGSSSSGGGSSNTTKALPVSKQATTLHAGYTTDPENMPALIAQQQGYFKQNGLDVTLTPLSETSTLLPSLGKQYDLLAVTPVDVLLARAHGIDVSFIQGQSAETAKVQDAGLVVEHGVTSLQGLKGKTIAVPSLSGVLYGALAVALHRAGMTTSDVRLLVEPLPEEGTLLQKGKVDAALTVQPFVDILQGSHFLNLGDPVTEATNGRLSMDTGYAAQTSFIQQNPHTIAAFQKSEDQAVAWMKANPAGVVKALEKYFQLPAMVAAHYPLMPYIHLGVTEAELQEWVKPLVAAGLINASQAKTEDQAVVLK